MYKLVSGPEEVTMGRICMIPVDQEELKDVIQCEYCGTVYGPVAELIKKEEM